MNVIALEPYVPNGNIGAIAFKAEVGSDWQGACDSKAAKGVPYS